MDVTVRKQVVKYTQDTMGSDIGVSGNRNVLGKHWTFVTLLAFIKSSWRSLSLALVWTWFLPDFLSIRYTINPQKSPKILMPNALWAHFGYSGTQEATPGGQWTITLCLVMENFSLPEFPKLRFLFCFVLFCFLPFSSVLLVCLELGCVTGSAACVMGSSIRGPYQLAKTASF